MTLTHHITIKNHLSRLGISCAALFSATTLSAQTSLSMADRVALSRARTTYSADAIPFKSAPSAFISESTPKMGLLVRFDSEETLDNAVAEGLEVISRYGNRAIVATPIHAVEATASLPGVRGAALLRRRHLLNASTRRVTGVNEVQQGEKLPNAYGGAGVAIGFYDGGIDPSHINFRGPDGLPRIKNLWCYPMYDGWMEDAEAGIMPPADKMLDEYIGSEAVATFTTDDRYETHGTHVMGIAAGGYVHTSDKDFHGMAPEADMLVACGRLDDYSIMDGVTRIAEYAYDNDLPCVINLSLGFNSGPHDGTDEFTSFFNDIVEKYGIAICMAAGNEANKDIALVKDLTASDTTVTTLTTSPSSSSLLSSGFEVWAADSSPLEVTLDLYVFSNATLQKVHSMPLECDEQLTYFLTSDYDTSGDFASSENEVQKIDETFSRYFTGSMICGVKGINDMNGRYSAFIDMDLTPVRQYENSLYVGVTVKGAPGQRVFLYSPDQSLVFDSMGLKGFDVPDGNGSINAMACGPNTIAVGAYYPQLTAANPYGKICSFSSWSDMWDGSVLPHIVAPGNSVISSISGHYFASGMLTWGIDEVQEGDNRYFWAQRTGTSMACPAVTGILALWLSANPSLTPDELRNVLVSTASKAGDASKAWGSGRVNAFAGIVEVLGLNDINSVIIDSPAIFLDTDADSHTIACRGTLQITVEFFSISGAILGRRQSCSDVMTIPLSSCPSGVYIMKVTTDGASRTFKCIS